MKLKYRFLKILLLILFLGFLMNFAIQRHGNKKINNISINITDMDKIKFITPKKITNYIDKSSVNGNKAESIKELDIIKTKKELDNNPFINKSNIYIDLDGEINVNINQKIPIARIKNNKEEFYLDKEGNTFPTSTDFSYPCMLVTGKNINIDEYSSIAKLCNLISVDNLLKNHIIGIKKDNENSYTLLLNIEGVYIEYGDLKNNQQKLVNLKEFYKQYLDYVGFKGYKKISLRYNNQIVATKR